MQKPFSSNSFYLGVLRKILDSGTKIPIFCMERFQNIFFQTTFHHHFRPKIVFLDTDSILRVKTMYESVKQDVCVNHCKTFRKYLFRYDKAHLSHHLVQFFKKFAFFRPCSTFIHSWQTSKQMILIIFNERIIIMVIN